MVGAYRAHEGFSLEETSGFLTARVWGGLSLWVGGGLGWGGAEDVVKWGRSSKN